VPGFGSVEALKPPKKNLGPAWNSRNYTLSAVKSKHFLKNPAANLLPVIYVVPGENVTGESGASKAPVRQRRLTGRQDR
jgi:hypothetical protein